jgi:hypothetical protein
MKTFKEILSEKITVDISNFTNTTGGKKPSAYGGWAFSFKKDMSDPFFITDKYANTVKKAKEIAKKANKNVIYVGG